MSIDAEQILDDGAKTGKMDYSKWPEVLAYILPTLENIVYNEFPTPRIPIIATATPSPTLIRNGDDTVATNTTPTRSPKATVIPATPQNPEAGGNASLTTPEHQPTSPSMVPNSQPPAAPNSTDTSATGTVANATTAVEPPEGTLPPPVLALYNGVVAMFKGPFGRLPPYTLQRLFELILSPRRHYNTLPAYLRALDKILNVASTADVYPLPVPPDVAAGAAETGGSYLSQANGVSGGPRGGGRDDAFNGAELTRIPWVKESAEGDVDGDIDAPGEPVDGVAGIGSPPDRILLEDAQPERGRERHRSPNFGPAVTATMGGVNGTTAAVPADTVALQSNAHEPESAAPVAPDAEKGEEMAVARGPQEIGNEDIGPQKGDAQLNAMPGIVDLEAAVGRPGEGEVVPGSNVQVPEERLAKEKEKNADVEMAEDGLKVEKEE